MSPINVAALFGCILLLSACASPEERCIRRETQDLRNVNALIAEAEANLARGYRLEEEVRVRPRLTFCAGGLRSHVGASFCRTNEIYTRDRPVAIDPDAERRKLETLRRKQRDLQIAAQTAVTACRAPGGPAF